MLVAYSSFEARDPARVTGWGDPKQFPALFSALLDEEEYETLIDDGEVDAILTKLDLSQSQFNNQTLYIFFAKDKATVVSGFRAIPLNVVMDAGGGQVGFFSGSYDFEKFGAWRTNKIAANKNWGKLTPEVKQLVKQRGMSKSKYITQVNRERLQKRGYFVLVANSTILANIRQAHTMQGKTVTFPALAALLRGKAPKMGREEALGALMDDLLIG